MLKVPVFYKIWRLFLLCCRIYCMEQSPAQYAKYVANQDLSFKQKYNCHWLFNSCAEPFPLALALYKSWLPTKPKICMNIQS